MPSKYQYNDGIVVNFVKKNVIPSGLQPLFVVNVEDPDNLMKLDRIDIGFGTRTSLNNADVSDPIKAEFRSQCRTCLQSTILKLLDMSPLKKNCVPQLHSLDPSYISRHPNSYVLEFENFLKLLVESRRIEFSQCEQVISQYKSMVENDKSSTRQLASYDKPLHLDKFYRKIIGRDKDKAEL